MKQKKYFSRVILSIVLICMAFSLIVSVAYYSITGNNVELEFVNARKNDSVKAATAIESSFKLFGISAKVAANQLILLESGAIDLNTAFSSVEEICNSGVVYIADSDFNIYNREDSPGLPQIIVEKAASAAGDERILSFMRNGEKYVVAANHVKTDDGRRVLVMRVLEETFFFELSNSDAIVFLDGDEEKIYIGGDGKCGDLKAMLNESGSDKVIAELENMNYRGRNMYYIPTKLAHSPGCRMIMAFDGKDVDNMKKGNLPVSIAMFFIVSIVLSLLGIIPAKIIYHPIDELVAFSGFYASGVAESDEVSYISGVIKALDEKNKSLNSEADEKKERLKIQFIKDLLSGVLSETEYSQLAEEFKMTEYETPFYVGIFEISDYDSLLEIFDEKNLIEIKKQIGEFITDELMGRSVSRSVEMNKKRFAVITYGCDITRIRQNFSYIISVINAEYDIEMFSAISGECVSLFEAGEGYQMCAKAFEDSFVMGFRSAVVVYDEIDTGAGFYYPVNLERDLISSVLRLKKEESLKIINNILDENLNGKTFTKEKHNAIVFAFTATVNRIVEAFNKTVEEVYGEENIIFLELKMCNDAASLRAKIIKSFDKIMNYMSGDEDADLSQRFLDYIHSHYNEDISLTEIGAHFKLSECYLSTVFKETTGENFKEYLSRYRIRKAREILGKNPGIKTKELAAMIGCNTVATLFRLFNKYEGMSPGQFVKEKLKSE